MQHRKRAFVIRAPEAFWERFDQCIKQRHYMTAAAFIKAAVTEKLEREGFRYEPSEAMKAIKEYQQEHGRE